MFLPLFKKYLFSHCRDRSLILNKELLMTDFCRIFTVFFVFILCLASTKAHSQCTKDTQCKGNRICVNGECVNAPPPPKPKSCVKDMECPGNQICQDGICMEAKQKEAAPPQPPDFPQTQSEPLKQTTDIQNIPSSARTTNESQKSRLFLEPGLGLNLNWCGGKDYEWRRNTNNGNSKTYVGVRLGGGLGFRLSSAITIKPNVYFDQKGYTINFMQNFLETKDYSYLSFPITTQWYFATNSRLLPFLSGLSPFLSSGPVFAFCLSSKWSFPGYTKDGGSNTPAFFFGLMAGAGAAYKAGPGSLVFDAEYTWGLTKIIKDAKYYQNTLSFTIGYRFEL
jgi:hypothetical protein